MEKLKLKNSFPTTWEDLAFHNRIMKSFAMLALVIAALSNVTALLLLQKEPIVLTLDSKANEISRTDPPAIELEVEKAVRSYLEVRYKWQPETQANNFAVAKEFVAPQSVKAFEKTANELIAFSKGKNISQRVYPTLITVDGKTNRVEIVADRFDEIQGLKAASALHMNLFYQTGARTAANPWGIYFVKEEEVQ